MLSCANMPDLHYFQLQNGKNRHPDPAGLATAPGREEGRRGGRVDHVLRQDAAPEPVAELGNRLGGEETPGKLYCCHIVGI